MGFVLAGSFVHMNGWELEMDSEKVVVSVTPHRITIQNTIPQHYSVVFSMITLAKKNWITAKSLFSQFCYFET